MVEENAEFRFHFGEVLVVRYWFLALIVLAGCSSAPTVREGILAPTCAQTAVTENDVSTFGFQPVPGKIVVLHIFASWCPFCKTDLGRMSEQFRSGKWSERNVSIFLLAYANHSENKQTFDEFVKKELASYGIPKSALQIHYVDKAYPDLVKTKTASGQTLLEGWKGIPFALVFGKDGRLAFRGHFTMSDASENAHYQFISQIQSETCK